MIEFGTSKETRRQANQRINTLLASIKDKNKVYSYYSIINLNKIEEINRTSHNKKEMYCFKWCDKCLSFTTHYKSSLICCKCKSRKTGLGNPNIHKKTIQT